jgi:tetratricopeptide (TPR) repeat protein
VAEGKKRQRDQTAFKNTIKKLEAVDWSEKGYAQFNRGKYDQAIQDYNRAIELSPNQAVPYYNRARVYSRQERYEQVLQDLRKPSGSIPILKIRLC